MNAHQRRVRRRADKRAGTYLYPWQRAAITAMKRMNRGMLSWPRRLGRATLMERFRQEPGLRIIGVDFGRESDSTVYAVLVNGKLTFIENTDKPA